MVNCFVPNCNHYSETKICKFFRFPVNKLLKLKWTQNIRRSDRCPSVNSRVCSCHFIDGLKENNPTIFSWNKEKTFLFVSPEKRNKRKTKPISKTLVANKEELPDELEENHSEVASQTDIEIESQMNLYESTKHNEENSVLHLNVKSVGSIIDESENALLKIEIERLNSTINSLKKQPFSFAFIEDNDEAITYYTGMPNKTVIHVLFDIFKNVSINYFLGWNVERISRTDQIFMTLMKLRHNFDFTDLGVRFGCSRTTVTNIVLTWIHAFHTILFKTFMNSVPSQQKNKACLPSVFNNFVNCRMILDCTEIYTAIPSKMELQKLTYSNYKHRNTLKGLVGIAPNGVLTFCSLLYPGSTSDKEIVKHSGVIDVFNSGDLILADKGFLINDLLPEGVSLNIPPFLGAPQFTPNQVMKTLTIARARVHVERAINRIKGYSILEFITPKLVPYASIIFQVCGALSNFQYPLIKEVEMFYLQPIED